MSVRSAAVHCVNQQHVVGFRSLPCVDIGEYIGVFTSFIHVQHHQGFSTFNLQTDSYYERVCLRVKTHNVSQFCKTRKKKTVITCQQDQPLTMLVVFISI